MTDIHALLQQRWSCRAFTPNTPMSDEHVELILEAGRWAPSAMNRQPWEFVAARPTEPLWDRLLPLVEGHSDWAVNASLWIVNLLAPRAEPFPGFPNYEPYDLGAAVFSTVLQAEALGYKCCQFASFDHQGLLAELGLSSGQVPYTMTAIGIPLQGEPAHERTRITPTAAENQH